MADTSNCFILVDKPIGISSFDVIKRLRHVTHNRKIGHAGTLDPFATGLLVCAIGSYTRLLQYVEAMSKSYEATIQFGEKSSTGDPEGEIIETSHVKITELDEGNLKASVLNLDRLPVPQYSAVKINGKRAYKLAREGVKLDMPDREVTISDFSIIRNDLPNSLSYSVTVSKGTYIRSLSEWIAEKLEKVGMTIQLRRTSISSIDVKEAHKLDNVTSQNWHKMIYPVQEILGTIPKVVVTDTEQDALNHGRSIADENNLAPLSELAAFNADGNLVAIVFHKEGLLQPKIVFNTREQ